MRVIKWTIGEGLQEHPEQVGRTGRQAINKSSMDSPGRNNKRKLVATTALGAHCRYRNDGTMTPGGLPTVDETTLVFLSESRIVQCARPQKGPLHF